jgi:predicted porin
VTLRGSLLLSPEDATAFGFCGFLANQQQAENRMNKKLITLAVATAMTAPASVLAEATLYGKLNASIDYYDIENGFKGWTLNRGQVGEGEADYLTGRGNRIGIKGSEDLGNGLKAIYQVEFGIPLANEEDYNIQNGDRGTIYMRNSFVGLAGNFGTFLVGRHDTPYKISTARLDLFADTMADYNGTIDFSDIRADNAIAYISPSFRGFQLAGAIIPGAASTLSGDENTNADSIAEAWSVAGIYSNGPFYGSVAYEFISDQQLAEQMPDPSDPYYTVDLVSIDEAGQTLTVDVLNEPPSNTLVIGQSDWKKWRFGLGLLDWNGFTLDGIYANWDLGTTESNLWQVQAGYAFGNNMIKGMWGTMDVKDVDAFGALVFDSFGIPTENHDSWAIGVDHNFSKRTKAYMLYTDYDVDNTDTGDWSGFSVGMMHSF